MSENRRRPLAASASAPPVEQVAGALQVSIGLLVRRLRQVQVDGELTLSESSALARLDRGGPTTATALARIEQVTPQSMGATLTALAARGLIPRRPDPDDGRRAVVSLNPSGLELLRSRRSAKSGRLAEVLSADFSADELATLMAAALLIERLAEHV